MAVTVVAGLPGAGKTTLTSGDPRALDSDALREAMAPHLRWLPYPLWRPLVHARHWLAIWRATGRPDEVILVRPFTTGWLRRAVLRRARRLHPEVHLVVVEATGEQARAGQRARGRTIRERAMRRHERAWARAEFADEAWTSVAVIVRRGLCCPGPWPERRARSWRCWDSSPGAASRPAMSSTSGRRGPWASSGLPRAASSTPS